MSTTALTQETYLPDRGEQVERVHDFLKAHEESGPGGYFLVGSAPGDRVELPVEVYRVLRKVVDTLRQGLAVTVAPVNQTLTTQQAADLLGVSRPTVIKLLDDGKIPFERVGTHRRVLLRELLAYRERRRAEQYAALEATAVSFDEEEDLDTALRQVREARRAVASRRRQHPAA
jgi:excisionase family DNA binding protein